MTVLLVDEEMGDSGVTRLLQALSKTGADPIERSCSGALAATLTADLVATLDTVIVACGEDADPGHRACLVVRSVSEAPLAMVSESAREVDELMAFANGCDDFICAHRSPAVLTARLNRLITRGSGCSRRAVRFGSMSLDPMLRTAAVQGSPISLTPIEYDLAETLIINQRRVVPRSELLERVWGGAHTPAHVLEVHMSRLRTKVLSAGGPYLGEPVRGVGYRVGRVTCQSESESQVVNGMATI